MSSRIELSRDVRAVVDAREWLASELTDLSRQHPDVFGQVLIMASELVTNVLLHTASTPTLVLTNTPGEICLGVADDEDTEPRVQPRSPGREGGNGMLIVDSWAKRWGVDHRAGDGKTVWFSVGLND